MWIVLSCNKYQLGSLGHVMNAPVEHLYWLYFLFSAEETLTILRWLCRPFSLGDWLQSVCVCVFESFPVKKGSREHVHQNKKFSVSLGGTTYVCMIG